MKFNKFKKEIKNAEYDIPNVLEDVRKPYEKEGAGIQRKPFFTKKRTFVYTCLSIVLVALTITIIILSPDKVNDLIYSENTHFKALSSQKELNDAVSYYRENNNLRRYLYMIKSSGSDIVPENAENLGPSEEQNTSSKSSSSNIQVEGVDEADKIKFDSNKVYRTTYDGRILINPISNGNIGETKTIFFASEDESSYGDIDLYLTENYIIVIGYIYNENKGNISVLRIYDKETYELVKNFESRGYFLDSRLIKSSDENPDTLYLIINQYLSYDGDNVNKPSYYINNEFMEVEYNDILTTEYTYKNAYTIVFGLRLDTLEHQISTILSCESWSTVYMTKDSLYLAGRAPYFLYQKSIGINDEELYFYNFDSTAVIKYDIDLNKANPVSSLITDGQIKDQFSIDEYNGYLRLALGKTNQNKVEIYNLVFDEESSEYKFNLVGSLSKDLGEENEIIKSARFNGDECIIVTAKNTDPLYKIDLSDPENPVALGYFKEGGYNSYLQYLRGDLEGLAIGLGYQTLDVNDYYVKTIGTKFGLYDVSSDSPIKLDENTFDSQHLDAIDNHLALFIYENYIGFEADEIYHLYEVVKDEDYKLEERLTLHYGSNTDEIKYYYSYGSRLYYNDGYFYLAFSSFNNPYSSSQNTGIISFNSLFEEIEKIN